MKTITEFANKCLHEMNTREVHTTECIVKYLDLWYKEKTKLMADESPPQSEKTTPENTVTRVNTYKVTETTFEDGSINMTVTNDGLDPRKIVGHLISIGQIIGKITPNEMASLPTVSKQPTVYLMDIDNEATVIIAKSIADAMDKAERISKVGYKMVYSKSLPLVY